MSTPLHSKPLSGLRVCFAGSNRISRDTRAYREIAALVEAGALVTVVNADNEISPELESLGLDIHLTGTALPPQHQTLSKVLESRLAAEVVKRRPISKILTLYKQNRLDSFIKHRQEGYWPELERLIVASRPDVIHCTNLYTAYPCLRASETTGAKIVYDSYELWSGVIADPLREILFPPTMQEILIDREREIAQRAAAIITVSDATAERIASDYDVPLPTVIYNGALDRVEQPRKMTDKIRLLIQGNNQLGNNIYGTLSALALLDDRYTLTLQGSGMDSKYVLQQIADLNISNRVTIAPLVPLRETVNFASKHDIGVHAVLTTHSNGYYDINFDYTIPNRVLTYMSAGLAIASSDTKSVGGLVDQLQLGVVFSDGGNPSQIAQGIELLSSDPEMLQAYKQRSVEAAKSFMWSAQAEKLVMCYQSLVNF